MNLRTRTSNGTVAKDKGSEEGSKVRVTGQYDNKKTTKRYLLTRKKETM